MRHSLVSQCKIVIAVYILDREKNNLSVEKVHLSPAKLEWALNYTVADYKQPKFL